MRTLLSLFIFISSSLALFMICGCSANQHAKRADKDVYAILKVIEQDIFGKTSEFTIDTPLSGTKAKDVTAQKILTSRSKQQKLTLSLDQALDYAIKNSREYQSEKERLYLTALTLTDERHSFRPRLFGRTNPDYRRLSDGERQGAINSTIGVNQTLQSGASLGLNIANDLLRYFTGDPRRSAASVISLNITQPLLRGAGRKIAAERLNQANRNVVYAVRDFTHFQNTFSVRIVTQYFDLLQSKNVIFNEYNNYESRKANSEYLKARVDRESPEAADNAKQDELQAKDRYIRSITNYRNALDRFKIALGLPQTTDLRLEDKEIEKVRETGVTQLHILNSEAFVLALKYRLPLFNQIDRFEDSKRQIAIAANNLKADLNIVGGASLNNNGGPTDYTQFNFKDVRANVGLQLDLPLDRLRERNQYRSTLITFESSTRTLGREFDQLRNLLDQRIRELDQFSQSYLIQKNAVELAKKRVEGNRLRLQAGTVIFRRLSEAQDALINAQNGETRALVDYLEARLNLLTDLGILKSDEKSYWLKENPSTVKSFQKAPTLHQKSTVSETDEVVPPNLLFR